MNLSIGSAIYKVWACDNQVYGPIDLPTLVQWTVDERILPETWILRITDNAWLPAGYIPELRPNFAKAAALAKPVPTVKASGEVQPEELRQFGLFTGVSNEELVQFLEFAEFMSCRPDHLLIRKGDPGDAIFFLLSGQARARLMIGYEEKLLTPIKSGEFFGEMAMLTQSARSADVVVSEASRLLRVTSQAFLLMAKELPALACPILVAMCRTLAQRVTGLTQQFSRDRASEYVWR